MFWLSLHTKLKIVNFGHSFSLKKYIAHTETFMYLQRDVSRLTPINTDKDEQLE
jgi:hypothetical protein